MSSESKQPKGFLAFVEARWAVVQGGIDLDNFRLIPHLPVLNQKLSNTWGKEGYVDFQWQLAALPYSLASTYAAYVTFHERLRDIVVKHENSVGRNYTVLNPSATYPVCFAIDHFLDSARRTQNAITTYLSAAARRNFPDSFNDLMKGLQKQPHERHYHSLPGPLKRLLLRYWRTRGERLKHYRDLAQHHGLVASEARLFRPKDGGATFIYLALPFNPEAKKAATWGSPPVHAHAFLDEHFRALFEMVYMVTKSLNNALPGEPEGKTGVYPRPELVVGNTVAEGYRPLTDYEIETGTQRLFEKLEQEPVPEFTITELRERPGQ